MQLEVDTRGYSELGRCDNIEQNETHAHVAYPYRSEGARIRLIRDASPKVAT